MDFSTYTALKTSVADFLNRDDLNTGGQIAGFIQLAEATMARRLRRSTNTATLAITAGANSVALPADVGELRSVSLVASTALPNGGPPLSEVSFETLLEMRANGPATGAPYVFAVRGSTLYVSPAPASQYLSLSISYFSKLVPLSGSVATNAVLAEAPDAYLYGACLEAAPFLEHDERIPVWQGRFDTAIEELNEKRQREEFGASLKKARLPVSF